MWRENNECSRLCEKQPGLGPDPSRRAFSSCLMIDQMSVFSDNNIDLGHISPIIEQARYLCDQISPKPDSPSTA